VVGDYIGDAVFAFWNCPTPNPRHPFLACKAALDQQKKLKELRESWKDRFLPTLNVRMGLTVGNVLAGNIGNRFFLRKWFEIQVFQDLNYGLRYR
jgi:adenylate cyclase